MSWNTDAMAGLSALTPSPLGVCARTTIVAVHTAIATIESHKLRGIEDKAGSVTSAPGFGQ